MKIGRKIYRKEKVYNSLDWAKLELQSAPDGSIFLADFHKYSHGRQGRVWKDYDGQLKITVLLKPEILPDILKEELPLRLNQLNMALSLGILERLKSYKVVLKWPNDFIYEPKPPGRRFIYDDKKVGGMILEAVWQGNVLLGIVFACAINVNNEIAKNDELYQIATSLFSIVNEKIDEESLLENLITSLDRYYKKWLNSEFDQIYEEWKENQFYLGKRIKVHKKDGAIISGMFDNLMPNGDLILIDDSRNRTIIPFFLVEGY